MKTGLFVEHTTRPAPRSSSFNGNLSFNTDAANPLNTNVGFANALLGAVTQYTGVGRPPVGARQFMNTEWYVQDNWRVKRNFTIDAGVRFYYMTPTQSEGDKVAQFEPAQFGRLGRRRSCSSRSRRRRAAAAPNPLTGEIFPLVYIGRLVPGSGNFTNGMQVYDGTPQQTVAVPGRAAHRLRVGRDRRRQDRRPRRRRRLLRSVLATTTSSI